ncbi:hypothetical protein CH373_15515 [Leptospira perolatii]|uniref:Prolyl 4-hydroxylase alpha subunit Fe(2+) 2OG dioxygenase domain-containing protein n=1 Tax=Leptospira perolatii TaxID=2023191 RepID=A0A2M9ZJB6_9LEPT|nr:2OG-Fe(II) oxygenase [Leptospira perolatii]PJZ68824.1 hypothetical protein CH360_13975 [Leptospira perolatii]PJZ72155.1 hypothetical protein CH373_15515 [Leptospira perolatii]
MSLQLDNTTESAPPALAKSVIATTLNTETLLQLMNHEIGAIHIKNYVPKEVCEAVVPKTLEHPAMGHYHKLYTSSVGRIHMPHIDTRWDAIETKKYHDGAIAAIEEIRELFFPYISPIDKLRLLLQEYWPAGANLARFRNRACFVGACRVMQPKKSFFYPHNDHIVQETDAPEIEGLIEQFVANAYLQVPEEGGDLHLWLRNPTPKEKEAILDVEGLLPETIEPPRLVIHPEPGDLIICSSVMLHAVTPVETTHRVCMASFIGCKGPDQPLMYWS